MREEGRAGRQGGGRGGETVSCEDRDRLRAGEQRDVCRGRAGREMDPSECCQLLLLSLLLGRNSLQIMLL